jgi:hypothetical protein
MLPSWTSNSQWDSSVQIRLVVCLPYKCPSSDITPDSLPRSLFQLPSLCLPLTQPDFSMNCGRLVPNYFHCQVPWSWSQLLSPCFLKVIWTGYILSGHSLPAATISSTLVWRKRGGICSHSMSFKYVSVYTPTVLYSLPISVLTLICSTALCHGGQRRGCTQGIL